MKRRMWACWGWLCLASHAGCELPRVPFSGAYGGTAGAGSAVGWDRYDGNPAAKGAPGYGFSLAGYSPFGVQDLSVVQFAAMRDGRNLGLSLSYRGLFDAAGNAASETAVQSSWKFGRGGSLGGAVAYAAGEGAFFAGSAGLLWNRYPWVTAGVLATRNFFGTQPRSHLGAGFDVGSGFAVGGAWRAAVETFLAPREKTEWRFAAEARLHALLSVYAGLAPRHQTAALGLRFGMGGWEGFSAVRRHATLGSTSLQEIRWRRNFSP